LAEDKALDPEVLKKMDAVTLGQLLTSGKLSDENKTLVAFYEGAAREKEAEERRVRLEEAAAASEADAEAERQLLKASKKVQELRAQLKAEEEASARAKIDAKKRDADLKAALAKSLWDDEVNAA
jgi:regulator of protease activity HflC (stomatin/prohibitin superfamily)